MIDAAKHYIKIIKLKKGGVSLSKKFILLLLCLVLLISVFSMNFATAASKKVTLVVGNWPRENEPARVAAFKKYQKIMLEMGKS